MAKDVTVPDRTAYTEVTLVARSLSKSDSLMLNGSVLEPGRKAAAAGDLVRLDGKALDEL